MRVGATVRPFDYFDRLSNRPWTARNDKGSEIDVSPTPHTRSFRPCQVGALGVDGDIGIGGDGVGFDPEAVFGVWGDLLGSDGFYGPVPAGYGGVDPDWGRGGAQDGI